MIVSETGGTPQIVWFHNCFRHNAEASRGEALAAPMKQITK